MSWLVVLRPARDEMPFAPTPEKARLVADPAVTSGLMTAELRPFRISVR